MSSIQNAKNIPLNARAGTVPDVSGAMTDYFQPMVFNLLVKTNVGYQLVETADPINFEGVIQPLSKRELLLKPEGERSWTWLRLHASTSLVLDTDQVVSYLGVQTRVMARLDYRLYGYLEYDLVQDWEGSGP